MSDGSTIAMGTTRRTEHTKGFAMHDVLVADVLVAGEMYCPSCGKVIKRAAALCVHCGVAPTAIAPPPPPPAMPYGRKRRRVAIVLALTLGYWTWAYTIAVDWWRFLVSLIVNVLMVAILVALAVSDAMASSDGPPTAVLAILVLLSVCWLWPIVHTGLRRPQFFYHDYPQAE